MDQPVDGMIHACTLAELQERGRMVVRGGACPILLLLEEGRAFALDNRCPHLGFPLHRGSVEDGVLTCHWHHARFDITSGGTFDLWADDVPTATVEVRGDDVWVSASCMRPGGAERWRRRLAEGMAHNVGLVVGKTVLDAGDAGAEAREMLSEAALFGVRNRDGWDTGLSILTALGNVLPGLDEESAYLALYHGIRRVAADCVDEAPMRRAGALDGAAVDSATLRRWLRQWTAVRHRRAAERTLSTAVQSGLSPEELAEMLMTAATDRAFADTGHSLDFTNKALECLDLIGWDHAEEVLPSIIGQLVAARGAEESDSWRHPSDLVALVDDAVAELPALFARADARRFDGHAAVADALLADEPEPMLEALNHAIAGGATAADLGKALAYAAALRIARFGTANEFSDWDDALHVYTYCNAVHQVLTRIARSPAAPEAGYPEAVRGIFHGAMALYLTRYLNVPPARIPGHDAALPDGLPEAPRDILTRLLDSFDRQQQVDEAGRLAAHYLGREYPPGALIETLAQALLREDAGFHTYQMFEAGVRQYAEWGRGPEGRNILVAVARYLAAHSPTERSRFQTADIARRLHRGGALHEGEEMVVD